MKTGFQFNSLRSRTILTLLFILLIMILSIYFLLRLMITGSIEKLENQYVSEHVKRATNAVDAQVHELSITSNDWALWDDSYYFMDDGNQAYIDDNLNLDTLANFGLNYICYVKTSGEPLIEYVIDFETGTFMTPDPDILSQLAQSKLLTNTDMTYRMQGIIVVDEQLLMIASSPILTSLHQGPVNGNLIFGRYLDKAQASKISEQMELNLEVYPLAYADQDASGFLNRITHVEPISIEKATPSELNVYIKYNDVFGNPSIGLCVRMERAIYAMGMENNRMYMLILLSIAVIFSLAVMAFLEKNVLLRLKNLAQSVSDIGKRGIATRVKLEKREDEIHFVAASINQMLDKLEKTQHQLRESEENYKSLNEVLERRVTDRTHELTQSNETLRNEIRERLKVQDRIQYLAYHDALTGLPNRLLLADRMKQALPFAIRSETSLAIMYLDLDGFKMVNDTLGHDQGDEMLKIVSSRLLKALRKEDTVARIGGDEFIVLIQDVTAYAAISKVAEKIIACFQSPFKIKDQDFFITTSIGIAISPTDGEDIHTLMRNADIALYRGKEKGENQAVFCSTQIKDEVFENIRLTNHLYRAVDREELLLYYQPQINPSTNKLVGLEALIRWNHPEYGLISPGRFIPIAEQTGLILSIGEWILYTACSQTKRWQDAGYHDFCIAVNLSVVQFKNPQIADQIAHILDITGLDPKFLDLEITESIAMKESDQAVDSLIRLKQLGVKISIDDFGTEYSSFNYLKKLPIDKIKLDMNFVRGIGINKKDEIILEGMISLAKNLGLNVIAEGVETKEQLEFLENRNCDEIQGYYYYTPQPMDDVMDILKIYANQSDLNIEEEMSMDM